MISSVSLKSKPFNTVSPISLLTTSIVATKMSFCIIEAVSPIFLTRLNISKSTNIKRYYRIFFKSSYFNFVRIGIQAVRLIYIPPYPLKKMINRREIACLEVGISLDFRDENRRVLSQTLLGFYHSKSIASCRVSVKPLAYFCKSSNSHFFYDENRRT